MGALPLFLGAHFNGLDVKGRVSVPAEFRAIVRAEGLEGVYCWPSFDGPYLEGGGQKRMQRYLDRIAEMDQDSEMRRSMEEVVFGATKLLSFDANGRITLPRAFMTHANLDRDVVVVGLGERFEIRSPENHNRRQAAAVDKARQRKDTLDEDEAAKGESQ